MKMKEIYTVRNSSGQYLGSFYAYNEKGAIARLVREDANTASTFRKSQPATKFINLTAKVEARS